MHKKLYEQLEQANARIESLIHLGGMVASGDSLPDVIDDLLQEDSETLENCFPDMPEWVRHELDDSNSRAAAFSEWIHQEGKLGFLVQFATPVMRKLDEHCAVCSWGRYYTHWTYGETLEEATTQALAWVAERRAKELSSAA